MGVKITNGYGVQHFDQQPINTDCPHCATSTSPVIVSYPSFQQVFRYRPKYVGVVYSCTNCNSPIFLRYVVGYSSNYSNIALANDFTHVEKPKIEFDFEFIPKIVELDFKEALECYRNDLYNSFGSMCRRTIQSTAMDLGKKGTNKVKIQITEMKDMAEIDDETFDILSQIILDGHDGAHPHLPELSKDRADILFELMKDVMYQLYVRKGKIKKAADLRRNSIKNLS